MNVPDEVDGMPVKRVVDTWYVDDHFGSRAYCRLWVEDGREVTMLRTPEGWVAVFIESQDRLFQSS